MADRKNDTDTLDALRKKLGNIDMGGPSGFWKPPKGKKSTIRILPPVGDMEFFFQEVGRHYGLADFGPITCPHFTSGGEEACPVCDLVARLYRGSKADKALAKRLRVSKSFWMNVVVRDPDDSDGIEISDGPAVFTPGTTVLAAIQSLIYDPEYGLVYDIEEGVGVDLTIERSGEGLETRYQVNPRRGDTPLHPDSDVVAQILEDAKDLSAAYLTDDPDEDADVVGERIVTVLPYDRIVAEYGVSPTAATDELESMMSDDEGVTSDESDSSRSRSGSNPSSRPSGKVGRDISDRRRRRRTS